MPKADAKSWKAAVDAKASKTVYRIQPKGLGIAGHASESSAGVRPGIDVFTYATDLFHLDAPRSYYGDEVLVIEAPETEENNDVEGVRVDPRTAKVVARYPVEEFDRRVQRAIGLRGQWTPASGGTSGRGATAMSVARTKRL